MTFSQRWLEESGFTRIDKNKMFMFHNFIEPYPPLDDVEGCSNSKFEHSLIL